ncbi:MAG: hypothetical protein IPK16_08890 [Anaerolineales bacterium]|nr:hypothetical protein [Anaerolineales bacterium]
MSTPGSNDAAAGEVRWHLELESKPDFDEAMARIYAWFEQAIIDRPPVRFARHNALYEEADAAAQARYPTLKEWWFDEEYQIERFLQQIEGKRFLAETFPIFWPNLGPNVFAGCYGCLLEFGEVTSWAEPMLHDYTQPVALDWNSEYIGKLDNLTQRALAICSGKFMVGYTDLHPGIDWLAALRGSEQLCLDLFDEPDGVRTVIQRNPQDFHAFFNRYDAMLKAKRQLSVSWMGIPSFATMHIPSCDFATMISPAQFREFVFPVLYAETVGITHNVFHVDGKGVARHLDAILELPNIQAIQWVQGVGADRPIMQWVPLIQRIQAAGKSVVVDLDRWELDAFMAAIAPEGIFLCLASDGEEDEHAVLRQVAAW